jgi:hypothetical protein
MRHSAILQADGTTRYLYEWKSDNRWNKLGATVGKTFTPIVAGSAEAFIFEHYWGYNKVSDTQTMEYQVEHITWKTADVKEAIFDADIAALYGKDFEPYLSVKPYSAFFADGSEVNVRIAGKI